MLAQGLQSVGHTGAPQLHQGEITRELLDRVGARNEGPVVKWTQSGRDKPVSCPGGVVAIEGDNVLWICLCMCEARQTFTRGASYQYSQALPRTLFLEHGCQQAIDFKLNSTSLLETFAHTSRGVLTSLHYGGGILYVCQGGRGLSCDHCGVEGTTITWSPDRREQQR